MRAWINEACNLKFKRKAVEALFINKYCPFMMHKTIEDIFSRIKNYGNNQ
jgi:hypothetical protein